MSLLFTHHSLPITYYCLPLRSLRLCESNMPFLTRSFHSLKALSLACQGLFVLTLCILYGFAKDSSYESFSGLPCLNCEEPGSHLIDSFYRIKQVNCQAKPAATHLTDIMRSASQLLCPTPSK